MKKTGAWLARHALEQIGVQYTFGIPGVHNTELYDELNKSEQITPVLVTHEGHGGFMADAISRTTNSIGTMVIVPAAGVTHAASGIGEAFLDGIAMLVISGGIRSDSDFGYQLHEMDQHKLLEPITKAQFKIEKHEDVIPTLYQAYRIATSGEPGPVFVEIPVNIQLDRGDVPELISFNQKPVQHAVNDNQWQRAVALLKQAKNPGIFAGWGAVGATEELKQLAEILQAPVSTTLQGLSCFPADHPLHTGMSFGPAAVPAAQNAFKECDCLIAIGTRFGEIATGSFGVSVPENLIHIDINPQVFNRNYKAKVAMEGDAQQILSELIAQIKDQPKALNDIANSELAKKIVSDKKALREEWQQHKSETRVNPEAFFTALREQLPADGFLVVDDGNHTFLTAELMPILKPRGFISPTDFNCMGYAVPAAIATKLAHKDKPVYAVVGDGAFFMTCMELATAASKGVGVVICVFNDGELSQIAQAQQIPYNRKVCTVLAETRLQGIATATGAEYLPMTHSCDPTTVLARAEEFAQAGKPVIVDVHIDYSKQTYFTSGAVKTNVKRLPFDTKVRMIGRAFYRKVTG